MGARLEMDVVLVWLEETIAEKIDREQKLRKEE